MDLDLKCKCHDKSKPRLVALDTDDGFRYADH